MFSRIFSGTLAGVHAIEVEIEVNESPGEPKMPIVGLPDTAVRESRDRVLTALANSGMPRPKGRCTINLAPADLKKEGPGFDLPIALGILAIHGLLPPSLLLETTIIGELALDGSVRPVKGALAITLEAKAKGKKRILLPKSTAIQASVVQGIDIYGISTLQEAADVLLNQSLVTPEPCRATEFFSQACDYGINFSDVKGQLPVKRALEVSVSGSHNLLMIGPPGTGKSMIAKRIPTIMPAMTEEEAIETTKIHSAGGLLNESMPFVATRPFRAPHHTISDAGLLGGGTNPGPGEVSLAHHGILFLDELPEFRRSTLEVLRQPLEDRQVTISRASGSQTFPASFMLAAAMNPCPCGYYGDRKRECRCSPLMVQRYRQRISGPLLDRIDLHVEVPLVEYQALSSKQEGENSEAIRLRVEKARALQRARFQGKYGVWTNASMTSKMLREHATPDAEGARYLQQAMTQLNFSARAHDRILKVARTLADLEASPNIRGPHVLEAIHYRSLDRALSV